MGAGASVLSIVEPWGALTEIVRRAQHEEVFPHLYSSSSSSSLTRNQWMLYSHNADTTLDVVEAGSEEELAAGFKAEDLVWARARGGSSSPPLSSTAAAEGEGEGEGGALAVSAGTVLSAEAGGVLSLLPLLAATHTVLKDASASASAPATATATAADDNGGGGVQPRLYTLNLGLNVSHNGLSAHAVHEAAALLRRLQYLDIGGNGVACVSDITGGGLMIEAAAHAAVSSGSGSGSASSTGNGSPHASPQHLHLHLLPLVCCLQVLNLSYTRHLEVDAGELRV